MRYILGIPDHFNVKFGRRPARSAYSMRVQYTLVLHCHVQCTLNYSYIRYICVLLSTGM